MVNLYSNIKMMHGPIRIRITCPYSTIIVNMYTGKILIQNLVILLQDITKIAKKKRN